MIEYVLDTNTVSELMRGRPNTSLETHLARRWQACALPAPVVDELQYGVSRIESPARRAVYQAWLEQLLADLVVIPLDSMCAQWHGRERARLARTGRPPSLFDGLIASMPSSTSSRSSRTIQSISSFSTESYSRTGSSPVEPVVVAGSVQS